MKPIRFAARFNDPIGVHSESQAVSPALPVGLIEAGDLGHDPEKRGLLFRYDYAASLGEEARPRWPSELRSRCPY